MTDLSLDPRGGTILEFPGLEFSQPDLQIDGGFELWNPNPFPGKTFEMVYEQEEGRSYYRVNPLRDLREGGWTLWGISSKNTIRLKPNRSYVISVLLRSDFERPIEANVGLLTRDGAGKEMMSQLNGLPNKATDWQRWEWEFDSDPQAVHANFSLDIYSFPVDGVLHIAEVSFVELPPKELPTFAVGEGATFRGGPGNLPMAVESVQVGDVEIQVQTTGARYTFNLAADTILAEQLLERVRPVALWQSSQPFAGLKVLSQDKNVCLLANESATVGIQCDGLVMVVPHQEIMLTCESKIGGKWNRLCYGYLLAIDDVGGFAVTPAIPMGSGRLARVESVGKPGRAKRGDIDFAGLIDNQISLSDSEPGWQIKWLRTLL